MTREDCAQACRSGIGVVGHQQSDVEHHRARSGHLCRARETGRRIDWAAVEFVAGVAEERTAQLVAAGTPELIAKLLVSSQMAIATGKMGTPTTAVKELDRSRANERSRVSVGASGGVGAVQTQSAMRH